MEKEIKTLEDLIKKYDAPEEPEEAPVSDEELGLKRIRGEDLPAGSPPEEQRVSVAEEEGPPGEVIVRVGCDIRVDLADIPKKVLAEIEKELTFTNPLYKAMVRSGHHDANITQYLNCYFQDADQAIIPRGFASRLMRILQANRIQGRFKDETNDIKIENWVFNGRLYGYQAVILEVIGSRRFEILSGTIGSGKKVLALNHISHVGGPVLVVVRNRWQLYLWKETVERFLEIAPEEIGLIGDQKHEVDRGFMIGVYRSLYKHIDDLADRVRILVVDRCDHMNLNVFYKLIRKVNSKYMMGLATAPKREDKLTGLKRLGNSC